MDERHQSRGPGPVPLVPVPSSAPGTGRHAVRRPAHSAPGPHPTGGGVVGSYVHPYEPARQSYQQIPAMRPAQESSPGVSATPIYDALYSEYLRSFRTLPGDRSGEEDMGFKAFSTGSGTSGTGLTYGGMRAGAYATQTIPSPPQAHPHSGYPGQWQPVAVRPHAGHFPALPPAPRRET